ncbi:MAG: hypothetical protein EXR59_03870 [Dehalococcoidia bacterium]|nr:hypothetical protein [Dehalococcoidia bacterium]
MKAAAYFLNKRRTDARQSQTKSVLAQEFHDYCAMHSLERGSVFIDSRTKGPSAGIGYNRLLRFLSDHPSDTCVVIEKSDQLGATPEQSVARLLQLESRGVKIMAMHDRSGDHLKVALDSVNKRGASDNTGARIKRSMMTRAMRGMGIGKASYGYRVGSQQRLEVVKGEADVVHQIFTLRAEKEFGIRRIAGYLNDHSMTTRSGGKWNMITVRDILRNRTYIGTYTRFGMSITGAHPAIVSNDLFKAAQFGFRSTKSEARPVTKEFSLSGFVLCGYCGNTMIGVTRKRNWRRQSDGEEAHGLYRYYQCQSRTNQNTCRYHTRSEVELENMFMEAVEDFSKNLDTVRNQPILEDKESPALVEKRIERLLEGVRRRQRSKIRMGAGGLLNHAQLRSEMAALESEERAILRRLERMENSPRKKSVRAGTHGSTIIQALAEGAKSWPKMGSSQRQIFLNDYIDSITVHDDRVEVRLV